jgi:hypothetical protein
MAGERSYRRVIEGSLGELDHGILLRQYAGEAEAAAVTPGWRGGRYRLLEEKKGSRSVLQYSSVWASAEAADGFYRLYRRVLDGKWKTFEVMGESAGGMTGRGDDGHFLLRREGARVTSLEGLAEREAAKLLTAAGFRTVRGAKLAAVAIH